MFRAAMVQRATLKVMPVLGILLTASVFAGFVSLHLAHAADTIYYGAVNGNDNNK